jgi:hypothetical protein
MIFVALFRGARKDRTGVLVVLLPVILLAIAIYNQELIPEQVTNALFAVETAYTPARSVGGDFFQGSWRGWLPVFRGEKV